MIDEKESRFAGIVYHYEDGTRLDFSDLPTVERIALISETELMIERNGCFSVGFLKSGIMASFFIPDWIVDLAGKMDSKIEVSVYESDD